jgi:hypothetical protein
MNAKTALQMAGLAIDGLEVLQAMTKVGGDKAEAALQAIDKVIATLKEGMDGKASPQAVSGEIDALFLALAGNDEAADQALRTKFGKP